MWNIKSQIPEVNNKFYIWLTAALFVTLSLSLLLFNKDTLKRLSSGYVCRMVSRFWSILQRAPAMTATGLGSSLTQGRVNTRPFVCCAVQASLSREQSHDVTSVGNHKWKLYLFPPPHMSLFSLHWKLLFSSPWPLLPHFLCDWAPSPPLSIAPPVASSGSASALLM